MNRNNTSDMTNKVLELEIQHSLSTTNNLMLKRLPTSVRKIIKKTETANTEPIYSNSEVLDDDLPLEQLEFTKNQFLKQSTLAFMAQANAIPENVMQLLG